MVGPSSLLTLVVVSLHTLHAHASALTCPGMLHVFAGRVPDPKLLDGMLSAASGPLNFTMFLTLFGEKTKGTNTELRALWFLTRLAVSGFAGFWLECHLRIHRERKHNMSTQFHSQNCFAGVTFSRSRLQSLVSWISAHFLLGLNTCLFF